MQPQEHLDPYETHNQPVFSCTWPSAGNEAAVISAVKEKL